MDEEEFSKFLDRVRPATYFSLQEPVRVNEEGDSLLQEDVIQDSKTQDAVMQVLKEEDMSILKEVLQTLPQHQLQVLSLYYIEDLRLKEIAQILDLTESRVSQIHTMAITRLRSVFNWERKK
jgi:RNA polymerase sigma factor for flagellar operon FliA